MSAILDMLPVLGFLFRFFCLFTNDLWQIYLGDMELFSIFFNFWHSLCGHLNLSFQSVLIFEFIPYLELLSKGCIYFEVFLIFYNILIFEIISILKLILFSRGTRAQHLTLLGVCVWCVCVDVVCVWCPLDECDAQIGQRGKTIVQSQSVCTVQVYTQL